MPNPTDKATATEQTDAGASRPDTEVVLPQILAEVRELRAATNSVLHWVAVGMSLGVGLCLIGLCLTIIAWVLAYAGWISLSWLGTK